MTKESFSNKSLDLHLPNWSEIWKVFLVILFPVVFWALVIFSRELPSYLLRMDIWDIIGVLGYILVTALLDSVLLLSGLIFLGRIIPPPWFRLSFAAWGTLFAFGVIFTAIYYQMREFLQEKISLFSSIYIFWLVPAVLLTLVAGISFQKKHANRIESLVGKFHERIDLVSGLFLVLTGLGIVIVIVRNLGFNLRVAEQRLNRREFLKLLGTASIAAGGFPAWDIISETAANDPRNAPNILILVFDALSRQDMSLYGCPRSTTPNMERFANQATVYHRHYSGGSFTTPGTASLLTGVHPWIHRAPPLAGSNHE